MELTKIQKEAVHKILSLYKPHEKVKIDFKAPTGSGKTLMASWIISSLIERSKGEKDLIFVIATPSSSDLPLAFEKKLNLYKNDLPYSKFEVKYIESPSSTKSDKTEGTPRIQVEPNKVYIFGKSTFGRGRIFTERKIIDDFVDEVKTLGYNLIYIRDEAHIGDIGRVDRGEREFEELMQGNADFILKMTATPNLDDPTVHFVQVKESDLNDGNKNGGKWLLKTTPTMLLKESVSEDELLEKALVDFKAVKDEYKKLENDDLIIRPALLVQVSNEPSNEDDKRLFHETLDKIRRRIEYHNLTWAQYFGNSDKDSNTVSQSNFTLDEITDYENLIDVIIFKVGPSTGWDIPRACMLLQLRNVCSEKLNVQTIGRIKRNPYPNLEKNEITDKYYIYSNMPNINEDFTYYQYEIKEEFMFEEFPVIKISNKRDFRLAVQKEGITNDLYKYIDERQNQIIQQMRKYFVNHNGADIFRKELYQANGNMVYSEIRSPFIFLKELERLINSRKKLYSYAFEAVNKSMQSIFKNANIYNGVQLQKEHLQYVLFHAHTRQLTDIVKRNSPFTSTYEMKMVRYKPDNYTEIYGTVRSEGSIDRDETYLFNVLKNSEDVFLQPLDSKGPEGMVFNVISREIYALNRRSQGNPKVKIWAKNLTASNISGDYLDSNHTFRKSYFDFIIKFTNGNHLYIEVKSTNDINEQKTAQLRNAYKDYFAKRELNLFTHPIVISIWTVDGNNITHESYYEKDLLDIELNNLLPADLINTLANTP